ncbi:Auxin-responsive protein SAUR50 [Camellia lanceoleosa]|uniref:Auxin-responsive protein SAUR50 n=1 Tax=Camellia lanceoleosa TaxID=1840588 RepID=A0ACC0FZK0_9ERIC|nr:Auxin-responsive protein SAUR50 [Camellia lanceoleosa]
MDACSVAAFQEVVSVVQPPHMASPGTPTGHFAVYMGEEMRRFVVPTGFLSHHLLKMLLEKAYDEFGFEQRDGLVVPCSVAVFQEVVSAVRRR